jgi:hypothetical protein
VDRIACARHLGDFGSRTHQDADYPLSLRSERIVASAPSSRIAFNDAGDDPERRISAKSGDSSFRYSYGKSGTIDIGELLDS